MNVEKYKTEIMRFGDISGEYTTAKYTTITKYTIITNYTIITPLKKAVVFYIHINFVIASVQHYQNVCS